MTSALKLPSDAGLDAAWAALAEVPDPEIPVLSVLDLGIVRELRDTAGGGVAVTLTPTYSGCPATEVIAQSVVEALERAGFAPVRVHHRLAPAWSTEWISAEGRRKLREYGIAPPGPVQAPGVAPLRFVARARPPACPRCGSEHTERLSAFGATACKALWRCLDCREPFEQFKAL